MRAFKRRLLFTQTEHFLFILTGRIRTAFIYGNSIDPPGVFTPTRYRKRGWNMKQNTLKPFNRKIKSLILDIPLMGRVLQSPQIG